jgi:hypothetical protein
MCRCWNACRTRSYGSESAVRENDLANGARVARSPSSASHASAEKSPHFSSNGTQWYMREKCSRWSRTSRFAISEVWLAARPAAILLASAGGMTFWSAAVFFQSSGERITRP